MQGAQLQCALQKYSFSKIKCDMVNLYDAYKINKSFNQ